VPLAGERPGRLPDARQRPGQPHRDSGLAVPGVPRAARGPVTPPRPDPHLRRSPPMLPSRSSVDPNPPAPLRAALAAILYLEQAITTAEWGRVSCFAIWLPYGPGTAISLAADTVMAVGIPKRRFPVIGDDAGIWSYVRIEDVAAVTAAGVGHGQPGIYNVVDDNPAPVREWLPELARIVGGRATGTFSTRASRPLRGRGGGRDGHRVARCLERQGQARARLDAGPFKLAARRRRRLRDRRDLCAASGSCQWRTVGSCWR
jgi:nucleoside-diphosphate-sugar epimerase